MIVAEQIRNKIASFPTGRVFTLSDFGLDASNDLAAAKLLSRMASSGELMKVSKGKYYKPRRSQFGVLKPAYEELVKEFIEKDGEIIGYISGVTAFSHMGLTSQISSEILVGSNKYRRPIERGGYRIRFLLQPNRITEENVDLLLILDALKLIRDIPGTTASEACKRISALIKSYDEDRTAELAQLSLKYTNYVRALLGAIYEYSGLPVDIIRKSLNGVSSYYLPISDEALPTKLNWRIYEPARK